MRPDLGFAGAAEDRIPATAVRDLDAENTGRTECAAPENGDRAEKGGMRQFFSRRRAGVSLPQEGCE